MNAVILVGGGGTRLRPLTYAIPKPLIPVLNRPLVTYLIENLRRHGVTDIVLAASAADRRIEAALGDGGSLGVSLSYCYETEPLGSGLAVKQAARDFDAAFFVCNGDVISALNLSEMAEQHRDRGAAMSIFLAPVADPSSYGIADLDSDGRITRFIEKPTRGQAPSNFGNAGTWLFEPDVLTHIPDEKMDGSIERLLTPALIADDRLVLAYVSDSYWMDVGTPERYLELHDDLLSGRMPACLPDEEEIGTQIGEGSQVWPDAEIGPNVVLGNGCRIGGLAQITGPTVLGPNCAVREKATIKRSVLWSGVRVGAGAVISDSIIGEGCWIGDDAVVEGAVLANGARVRRGVHLDHARLEPDEVAG